MSAHRLGIYLFGGGTDKYTVNRTELTIPRTYPLADRSEAERIFSNGLDSLPHFILSESGGTASFTAMMSTGKPRWIKRFSIADDGTCVAHGEWQKYDISGHLVEKTEYKDGRISGRRWVRLDWHKHGADELESYWQGTTPVGVWKIDPTDVKHILISFRDGQEFVKESFGASSGNKILLRRWENGRETYVGDWVRVDPPKITHRKTYMGDALLPEFEPSMTHISELRRLAETTANKTLDTKT